MSIPADQLFPGFKTPPNFERCDMCGGDGVIEYLEGGPSVWSEDSPSRKNHLLTCPECRGRGA